MSFPVVLHLGRLPIPAHLILESLAYFAAFRLFLVLRRRWGDAIPERTRGSVVVAAVAGAAIGSKLLVWAQHPAWLWAHRGDPAAWLAGKTIVGGLLGGWIAVEGTKAVYGERRATGDLFALPLCAGLAIGRLGCFLAGLDDHTYGVATTLPWGVDFGDGVRRHPTQLYEVVAVAALAAWIAMVRRRPGRRDGDLFRAFTTGYLAFRLALESIKPGPFPYLGLSAIQVACLAGLLVGAPHVPRLLGLARPARPSPAPLVTAPASDG